MLTAARILSIDQGTTNTKALLLDGQGTVLARAARPMTVHCPRPGWIEQDARAIWQAVLEVMDECLEAAGGAPPAALAVSNQRESVIVWNRKTGEPCGPCVIWQCRRTAPFCADLRQRGLETAIRQKTGLGIDPLFSASKAAWLIEQLPDGRARAEAGELCMGTVDSWLLWNLTQGAAHACDTTNASRTQLMNLSRLAWDDELLAWYGIPRAVLPKIQPSSHLFGGTAGAGRCGDGVPICGMIGDSHAALFAHAAFRPRATKATYGTGSSLMRATDAPVASRHGLSATVAWSADGLTQYGIEGNITLSGGTMQWAGELLGLHDPAADLAGMAAARNDNDGVYLVPAMAGLGAPYWRDDARGLITGLTRGTTAGHLARAALESIAYQVRDVFDAMALDTGEQPEMLLADGGASRNDQLMQFQADILGRPVVRNLSPDLSAMGAAWLAGLAAGVWTGVEELEQLPRQEQRFEPRMSETDRRRLHDGWRDAVARVLGDSKVPEMAT
ncbi:FGGY family carbohydrate kinase [Paludibaculum fermentans]|uniref:FGGY family carbohydrate kinase n=1 Tax=Paludibaculum fermentans TaxID=1473598 RepID=UPI003EBF90CF